MTQRQILMVLTGHTQMGESQRRTGFHVAEAAYPWRAFTDAGYVVDFVTPNVSDPAPDSADRADPVQRDFLDDRRVISRLTDPARPMDVDASEYEAIFYVGGHGTMWDFPQDTTLIRVAGEIYESGGVVAGICHGPAGLIDLTLPDGEFLVAGKNLTAFSDSEERAVEAYDIVPFSLESTLTQRGARFSAADDFASHTVTDGRLVTGQNPASAPGTAEAVLKVLTAS